MPHTVVYGDKLYALAQKYNTTVDELVRLNNIANKNLIYVGQVLVLPGESSGSSATTPATTNIPVITQFGLVTTSKRMLLIGWEWSRHDLTDHYEVKCYYSWGQGAALTEDFTTKDRAITYTPPEIATKVTPYVKPISKTYKDNKGNECKYFEAQWGTTGTHYYDNDPPSALSTPSMEIKDGQMTITMSNLEDDVKTVEFEIVKNNIDSWITSPIPVSFGTVKYTCAVDPGAEYKVRCRVVKDGTNKGDWSQYSSEAGTAPAASSGITECRANSSTSVYLAWSASPTAKSYEIEYTTKREYFDSSDQTSSITGITTTSYTKTGLESGQEYFFRVRAVNENGNSAWSAIRSIVLGKTPSAPTTWSSTTKAITGEVVHLYWVHNSEDGSKQTSAELELDVGGNKIVKTIIPPATSEEEKEKTSSYDFDTSGYVEGTTLKWRVRTCGITGSYSEWSIQRVVDIYARPTLVLKVLSLEGELLDKIASFPFRITGVAGPSTQKPIGFHVSIVANESYETVDHIGNKKVVNKNGEVYSRYFDINSQLDVTLSANDIDLENTISYTVNCVVSMDSGLTAEQTATFTVNWVELGCVPNAEIGIDKDSYVAIINPYALTSEGELATDVTMSVYRKDFDGRYTEIARGLENSRSSYITDPHPSLDYVRYRIVATSISTGAVNYFDIMRESISDSGIIIQWDEAWSDFKIIDNVVPVERAWSGSLLKLPYNIVVSPRKKLDVVRVEYIGRQHPVSYYGTQIGESVSMTTEIPKYDRETIYAVERLSKWMGDVYVREPNGIGYWANIVVSYDIDYAKLIVPISLEVTRVEGGA